MRRLPADRRTAAALAVLVLVIYGRHLADGYLGDDFLYLFWLREGGLGELLRRQSLDSIPQVIRPLPAFGWVLSPLPLGAALQHGLSLLLHGICGLLVARVAARLGAAKESAFLAAALFLALPLSPEPVIWLSSAPDLWATAFALAALDLGLDAEGHPNGGRRLAAAALLFALSLASKESTLLLPAIAVLLAGRRHRWRLGLALGSVAALYLAIRIGLFRGLGGYLDSAGRSVAVHLDPLRFLRNALIQLPFRLLVLPLKRPGELALPLALLSTALVGAVAVAGGVYRRPRRLLVAGLAVLAALLPVAPVFAVSYDHESSRLIYFPAAVGALGLAAALDPPTRKLRVALASLLGLWLTVAIANAQPWRRASAERRDTLRALAAHQDRWPVGSTVLVAGHDSWRGAYLWRNGLVLAVRRHGLRSDLRWQLGTAALARRPDLLGSRVFETGPDVDGEIRDWTACQRALHQTPADELGRSELRHRPRGPVQSIAGAGRLEVGAIRLAAPSRWLAVAVVPRRPPGGAVAGRLFWRPGGSGLLAAIHRFNPTDSRAFTLFPGRPSAILRLPELPAPAAEIELRIETENGADPDLLDLLRVVELPGVCR